MGAGIICVARQRKSPASQAEGVTTNTASRICVVFGAGEYYTRPYSLPEHAFVVAADGGYAHARELGVHVDVVVGDFDSTEDLRDGNPPAIPVCAHSGSLPRRTTPDMLSATQSGLRHGSREFHIYGGLGGRVDHTISDIQQTAIVASHGGIAYLHGDGRIVTAISDAALHFAAHEVADTQYVSVFAHSDSVRDVTERGLKYRLDHATLSNLQVNGLSNEFIDGDAAQIAVGGGDCDHRVRRSRTVARTRRRDSSRHTRGTRAHTSPTRSHSAISREQTSRVRFRVAYRAFKPSIGRLNVRHNRSPTIPTAFGAQAGA